MGPGWHQRPRTFAPQASVMATGVRDNVGYEYTCFMRGGEDARLHERFSGGWGPHLAKAARGEDLQVEHSICGGYAAAFHFHATLPGMLGSTLIRDEIVQVGEPRQKRLLMATGMVKRFHHEQFPVDGI